MNESIFVEKSFEERDQDEKLEYPNLSMDEDTGQENENNDVKVYNISIHYLDDPDDLEGYETEFEGENLAEAIEYVKDLDDYDRFDYFVIESENGDDYYNSSDGRSSEESQNFVQELNEKPSLSDNILESDECPLPKEFMTIRHFIGREDGENFIQSYPGLVKDGKYYGSGDQLDEVKGPNDFEVYWNPDPRIYLEHEIWELPESISTLGGLAEWILDDWADGIIEDGYDVVNDEFVIDFWKDNHIFYTKKIYK